MLLSASNLFAICLVTQAWLFAAGAYAVQCPANCKCYWVLDSLEADCSNSGLVAPPEFNDLQIQHLVLSHNHIVEFPSELADLTSLIYLDLSNNQIEYIAAGALLGFTTLRTLNLANNSITNWLDMNPSVLLSNANSLQRLVLSGNTLHTFTNDDPNTLLVSQSLKYLELENCGIHTVSGDVLLNGLNSLEYLQLSGNPISLIATMPSKSLRVLSLSNCKLQRLNSFFLSGLPSLEVLNLSWNTDLQLGSSSASNNDADLLLGSNTLAELDLSYCNLDDINLNGLPNLSLLHLRGNLLRAISGDTFSNNTLLETIDLAKNSLRVIQPNTFMGLKRLAKLDLSYNEIAYLDTNIFRSNDVLSILNLSHNVFEKFAKIVSNSLIEINLSWCLLSSLDSNLFSRLTSIQRLDLSNNLLRDLPSSMSSQTLKRLDLSNCKLSIIRNNTFREYPELASLHLNGNRFTTPFPVSYFASNTFLDEIWLGDNPWTCNCHDQQFELFYDFLITRPQKLKDRNSLRCSTPPQYYGKTWEAACNAVWLPMKRNASGSEIMQTILYSILIIGGLVAAFSCGQKLLRKRKDRRDSIERRANIDERNEILLLNERIMHENAFGNAPTATATDLPSYDDAINMPKPDRPVKSMLDLTASGRRQKKFKRSRTHPEEDTNADIDETDYDELLLDNKQRFRSEEMLANRNKERLAFMTPSRRTGFQAYANSGSSRRLSIEADRFAAFQLRSQNMQSAEKIASFQSYENSPYTKRKNKIAEIPPFKRATLVTNSVEFLTDPEYETQSKSNSPFARRKPKRLESQSPDLAAALAPLTPAVENYYDRAESMSSVGSDFENVVQPTVTRLQALQATSSSAAEDTENDLEPGKRRRRKNSASRRVSGNFSANAAKSHSSSSSSSAASIETEPIVVVHKPMRETLF